MAADHQKIHPVHVEPENTTPKPTAPLVPPGSFRSEKGDPEGQHVLAAQPPPYPQQPPPPPSKPPPVIIRERRSCCRRCLCWTCCSLLLAVLAVAISAAVLFLVFRPKLPKYSVDSLTISQLSLGPDNNTLSAAFRVSITARNPNKKIGIYYRGGSHLRVAYAGTDLCEGPFPEFYQGHRNTTVVNVALTGQTEDASGLLQSMQRQEQTEGVVPLDLRAKVPVRVKIGKLKLMKWKFLVKCRVGVDSLSQVNVIRVTSSKCKFRFRL